MEYTKILILHVQHIILLHTNKLNNFSILLVSVTSMISVAPDLRFLPVAPHGLGVPLWPFLMSIHGDAFSMTYRTTYFIFYLVEVTRTIHIISVTLLHIVHLVMESLLLTSPLPGLSHDHIRYIVHPVILRPLRWVKQRLKSGLPCLELGR
jgi:hypothetical protein